MFCEQQLVVQSDGFVQFLRHEYVAPLSKVRQVVPGVQPPTHAHSVVMQTPWLVPLTSPEQHTDGQSVSIVQSLRHESVLPSNDVHVDPAAQPDPQPQ